MNNERGGRGVAGEHGTRSMRNREGGAHTIDEYRAHGTSEEAKMQPHMPLRPQGLS